MDSENKKISGSGKTTRGDQLELSGTLAKIASNKWNGEIKDGGKTYELSFKEFIIDEMGRITGEGEISG